MCSVDYFNYQYIVCRYETQESFLEDVELMFENCRTFNEDESEIGKAGISLHKFYSKRWKQLRYNFSKRLKRLKNPRLTAPTPTDWIISPFFPLPSFLFVFAVGSFFSLSISFVLCAVHLKCLVNVSNGKKKYWENSNPNILLFCWSILFVPVLPSEFLFLAAITRVNESRKHF